MYILDDVLSAVDAHVGRAIFNDCINGVLRKNGKAVILATHQVQYLPYADKVLVLDNEGKQAFFGTFDALHAKRDQFTALGLPVTKRSLEEISQEMVLTEENLSSELKPRSNSESSAYSNTTAQSKLVGNNKDKKIDKVGGVQVEDRVEGVLSWDVILRYIRSGGALRGASAITLATLSQILLMITDYWLRCRFRCPFNFLISFFF